MTQTADCLSLAPVWKTSPGHAAKVGFSRPADRPAPEYCRRFWANLVASGKNLFRDTVLLRQNNRLPLIAFPDASSGGIRLNLCAGWVRVSGELRGYGPGTAGHSHRVYPLVCHSLDYCAEDRRRAEKRFRGSRGADVTTTHLELSCSSELNPLIVHEV